jgi:hypothetical protein
MSTNGTAKSSAKVAHVNLMVDTIIANIDADGLRAIMRAMLAADTSFTSEFQRQVSKYLEKTKPQSITPLFSSSTPSTAVPNPTPAFESYRKRARCLMGCGHGFASLEVLTEIVRQATDLPSDYADSEEGEELAELLATVDGDIIQALTAVEKELHVAEGARQMAAREDSIRVELRNALIACQAKAEASGGEFAFERGLMCLESQFGTVDK